ncbi:hypothetical protein [Paraclostridium bifermentans]|uniref:hypothetical protein n=1 Tax=Paraclostridium bifermentans TaxID=1490 RepID=UPI0025B0EF37|nr:hypothetical protein [Paraclostridium bifermentans]
MNKFLSKVPKIIVRDITTRVESFLLPVISLLILVLGKIASIRRKILIRDEDITIERDKDNSS